MARAATLNQPAPSSCPPDRLFIQARLRSNVLQWGHVSRPTCHPGIQRTWDFLQRRFLWSSLGEDVRGFINACPVCNRNKTSLSSLVAYLPGLCDLSTCVQRPHCRPHHRRSV